MDTYQPSAFRLAERKYKYYKSSKNCCKDFLDVVDFSNIEANSPINKERIVSIKSEEQPDIPIYSLSDKNGFYFIPNGLKINDQAQLIKNSIYEYSSTPNYANFGKLDCNLWEKYKEEMFNKVNLTWVTLGYHYNWTTNIYENTPERITEFPNYLVDLSIKFATQCNFQSYQPEAGIINYYKVNSSMMKAHQDESEFTFHQPIVSMSIGNSCIFLLGGINTVEPPTAIWMRSGDVMVMGGHSRVFFHGVARIFPETVPKELQESLKDEPALLKFVLESRININIRQVFDNGKKNQFITDEERKHLLKKAVERDLDAKN